MTNEHQGTLQRLQRLERQNRRMKLAGLGAFVIAGAALLMGQTSRQSTSSQLKARSFVLVDAQGKARAALAMSPSGPMLGLWDENGNMRAQIALPLTGPFLQFYDANGKMRVDLSAELGWPGLSICDANGKQMAKLGAMLDGTVLDLNDAHTKVNLALTAFSEGPTLRMQDANGFATEIGSTDLITPTTGETHKTSAASVVLFGKDNKVLWFAPPQN